MHKKREFIIFISLFIIGGLITFFLLNRQAKPSVILSSIETKYNEEIYITLSLKNFKDIYPAFDIRLNFDNNALEYLGLDRADLNTVNGNNIQIVYSSEEYSNAEGQLALVFVDSTGGDDPISSKEKTDMVYLRFRAKKPNITTKVTFSEVNFTDSKNKELSTSNFNLVESKIKVN